MVRAVAGLVVAVGAFSVALNALAYAAAARHRRRTPPARPADEDEAPRWARVRAGLGIFVAECVALVRAILTPPLGVRAATAAQPHRRPVVLLHDWGQHRGSLGCLAGRLRRDGWSAVHVIPHRPLAGLEGSVRRVAAALTRIRRETGGEAVDVIAHGAAGLVARACVRAAGNGGVGRLVTLGTPHQGTEGAVALAALRPDSVWLTALGHDDPVPERTACTAIYSADDALVLPPDRGYYRGAFNVAVRGVGHVALLFSPGIYQLVRENLLAEGEPRAATGPAPRA